MKTILIAGIFALISTTASAQVPDQIELHPSGFKAYQATLLAKCGETPEIDCQQAVWSAALTAQIGHDAGTVQSYGNLSVDDDKTLDTK